MKFDPRQLIHQPARYEISVPGKLDTSFLDWFGELSVTEEMSGEDILLSRISGIFDQAGLLGLLRRLYAYGLPIISVTCINLEIP